MKKYFIVADVHGFYDEMMEALNKKGFDINNPDHIFVSLGDLLDRGEQPFECLDFVLSLPEDRKILIVGNHELLMKEMISRGVPLMHDIHNGTYRTAEILSGGDYDDTVMGGMKNCQVWKDYLAQCQFYYELGDNIFVHDWIPCHSYSNSWMDYHDYNPLWRNSSARDWKEATWYNGMKVWSDGVKEPGKTIWCGHWHTSWGHSIINKECSEFGEDAIFTPFKAEGICAMDACTVHSHFVNCEVIEYEN